MVFVEIPKLIGPAEIVAHHGPIFTLDLLPNLGGKARSADRTGIPAIHRFLARGLTCLGMGNAAALAALFDQSAPRSRNFLTYRFDKRRKRRLAIGADRNIDRLQPLEVLKICSDV